MRNLRWLLPLASLLVIGCSVKKFSQPVTFGGEAVSADRLNKGFEGYARYCMPCHGENGDGKGVSGAGMPNMSRPPRDFTQGLFKFGGVAAPALPPDSELKRIVRSPGLHELTMLPSDFSDSDLSDILSLIKTFSPKWKEEKPGALVDMGLDPYGAARKDEAIALGRSLYHAKAQCSGCHPSYVTHEELFNITKERTGNGQTEFSAEMYHAQLKDTEYCLEWKTGWKRVEDRECVTPVKVMPPDFTRDPVHSVRLPSTVHDRPEAEVITDDTTTRDLYRTIASGIGGANMPTWKGALTEQEIWGLVYYTKSLIAMNNPADAQARSATASLHARLADPANLAWWPPSRSTAPADWRAYFAKCREAKQANGTSVAASMRLVSQAPASSSLDASSKKNLRYECLGAGCPAAACNF